MAGINSNMIYLLSTLMAKVGSGKPPCACPGAGWRALTQCSILPSQAAGLTPERLLCINCSTIDVFFSSHETFGLNFISNSELHRGRQQLSDHHNLAWSFYHLLLLAAVALCAAFWDIGEDASQLPKLFSGACVMSGLFVFSCDLGSIGCAVAKRTAAKWLSDYISCFYS